MTALTIGQFVRVQAPHPMQGMTGTVDYVEGGDVYVTLTAWGTDRLFAPRDLAPEERVPVSEPNRALVEHLRRRLRERAA